MAEWKFLADDRLSGGNPMRFYTFIIVLFLVVMNPGKASCLTDAMRKPCGACHTMHNSQDGTSVSPTGLVAAQSALLRDTCYGCHTGTNDGSEPYVLQASPPDYLATGTEATHNTLAGGTFYWVSIGDYLKGHDVAGIAPVQNARTAPGAQTGTGFFNATSPLTCAGTSGCHGDAGIQSETASIYGSHHSDVAIDGLSVAGSYRFIDGILGFEDPDWEYTVTPVLHNQYKGVDRSTDNDANGTISHLCTKCHGDFHYGATPAGVSDTSFDSPWIRHPVDYDMADLVIADPTIEYANYGDGAAGTYNVRTPVGSVDVSAPLSTNLLSTSGEAIIVCISCHRAHGSRWDYSLRWNYKGWPDLANDGYNGCGDCHTAKDN